jgi:hypothetical protein
MTNYSTTSIQASMNYHLLARIDVHESVAEVSIAQPTNCIQFNFARSVSNGNERETPVQGLRLRLRLSGVSPFVNC